MQFDAFVGTGLRGHEIEVRQKGRRHRFTVPYVAVWQMGAKLAAMEAKRERKERKGQRL